MLIPININLPGPSNSGEGTEARARLPPQLVQFGTDELLLIELQGALEVEGNKDGQLVGKLRVDPATNKPALLIGHHHLEGKLVILAKPLAVLHRNDAMSTGRSKDDLMDVDVDDVPEQQQDTGPKGWDIVAIVKRKMVFSKRPMPIVGRVTSTIPLSRIGSKAQ